MQNCIVTRTAISPAVAPRTRRKQTCTANITRCNLCHAAQRLDSLFAQHASTATCSHGAAAAASSVTRTDQARHTAPAAQLLDQVSSHNTQLQLRRLQARRNALARVLCKLCHANSSKTHRCGHGKVSAHNMQARLPCKHGKLCHTNSSKAHSSSYAASRRSLLAQHASTATANTAHARWRGRAASSVTRTQARHTAARRTLRRRLQLKSS